MFFSLSLIRGIFGRNVIGNCYKTVMFLASMDLKAESEEYLSYFPGNFFFKLSYAKTCHPVNANIKVALWPSQIAKWYSFLIQGDPPCRPGRRPT